MDLGLKGKVALVAASTKGLGKATAMALASEGTEVIVNGRDKQNISDTVGEMKTKTGKSPFAVQADVTKPDDVDRMFHEIAGRFGTIHILVTNAALLQVASMISGTMTG